MPGSEVIKTDKSHPHPDGLSRARREQKSLTARAAVSTAALRAGQRPRRAAGRGKSREAQCKPAKDRYMKAIASRRVYKEDKNGERTYMSDEKPTPTASRLRKAVQDACGSVPEFESGRSRSPSRSPSLSPSPNPSRRSIQRPRPRPEATAARLIPARRPAYASIVAPAALQRRTQAR